MAQDTNGKVTVWWQSRKLWMALTSAVLIVGVVLGGRALNIDPELLQFAVGALTTVGVSLIGAHAYTDVRALHDSTIDTIEGARNVLSADNQNMLPVLLKSLAPILEGIFQPAQPATATAANDEPTEGDDVEVDEESEENESDA